MIKSLRIRLRHLWLVLVVGPWLLRRSGYRSLYREMRRFVVQLPEAMSQPLRGALRQLDPPTSGASVHVPERDIRLLADITALLDRRSPIGLCLRRSLTRYHFLRRAGVAVDLQVGARPLETSERRRIAGHAWLTLDGRPYFEPDAHWQDFVVMVTWPEQVGAPTLERPV